jgi:hypothetical protein
LSNFEYHANKDAPLRRDIVAANEGKRGVWRRALSKYGANQIIFEVKNFESLDAAACHQAKAYTDGPYGKIVFIVYRSLRPKLDDNERSWVQQLWGQQVLLVLVPVPILEMCLKKQVAGDQPKYANDKFHKWVDTHERNYINPRAGSRGSRRG